MKIRLEMCTRGKLSKCPWDDLLSCHPVEELEGGKGKVGVFLRLWGLQQGGGVDHVPRSTLRRGRGNKGGLFSLSVLAGRLSSPLFLQYRGVMQGYAWEDPQKKLGCWSLGFNTVVPAEEDWRGSHCYRQHWAWFKLWPTLDGQQMIER